MRSADLLAERRAPVRDSAPGRVVPAAQVWVDAPYAPARALVEEWNRDGKLPPGLRAEVRHLVLRAAARALERQPAFHDFLLLTGGVQQNTRVLVRVPLDAEHHPAHCVVPDPGQRPLLELVAEFAAREVEQRVEGVRRATKLVRFRHARPLVARLVSEGLVGSLLWARDRLPALERRLRRNTRRSGTTSLRELGAAGGSGVLLACHLSGLLLAAPRVRLEGEAAEPRRAASLPLGLMFDARLFEAHEALEFLGEVAGLLADPGRTLA